MLANEDGAQALPRSRQPGSAAIATSSSSVALSPISVVHLFRQYFFELDTFLGTPVSHVWLSPGSTVELIEVHTRRTIVEKTLETALETIDQDREEHDAAGRDLRGGQGGQPAGHQVRRERHGVVRARSRRPRASTTRARRSRRARRRHKRMRQQTEKLSSEIRKNFKSTFKTVTEMTDMSSTQHVLANTTERADQLRAAPQDAAGRRAGAGHRHLSSAGRPTSTTRAALGLAKLIHIAKPAELDGIPHPEEIPLLQPFQEETMRHDPVHLGRGHRAPTTRTRSTSTASRSDDSEWFGNLEKIQADFPQEFVCPKSDYELTNVEFDPQGKPVSRVADVDAISNAGEQGVASCCTSTSADFQGQNSASGEADPALVADRPAPTTRSSRRTRRTSRRSRRRRQARVREGLRRDASSDRVDDREQDHAAQRARTCARRSASSSTAS